MSQQTNFKVEIYFDPNTPDLSDVCTSTDEIFSSYNMPCLVKENAARVYGDNGDPKDFGKLYAAIAKASKIPSIQHAVSDGYFDSGYDRETLMTSFFGTNKERDYSTIISEKKKELNLVQQTNFKVEIYFDPNTPSLSDVCTSTDEIFFSYSMPCLVKDSAVRIYGDNGDPKDCGKLFAAIGKIKRTPSIVHNISDGIFDWGDKRETLMTNFFRKDI